MHALSLSGLDSLTKLVPLAPRPSDGLGLISSAEMHEIAISGELHAKLTEAGIEIRITALTLARTLTLPQL